MAADSSSKSVRWIHAGRDALRRGWRRGLALLLVAAALVWLARGVYTVENGESAAILRFGRLVDDAVPPGLHLRLPGIDQVSRYRTGEVVRLEVEGDFAPELGLVTGDENLIEATLTAQYRISELGKYLYASEDPELLLRQALRSALVRAVAETQVDAALTSAKAAIQVEVRETAQRTLDAYDVGVTVVAVNLQSVNPPFEAAAAFREVSDSRADAAQRVNQQQGERARELRLSRGNAARIVTEARATADGRVQAAQGAADRFESLLARYAVAPGLTRLELHREVIDRVLTRTRLVVLAPGTSPRIDLQLLDLESDAGLPLPGPPELPPVPRDDR